MALALWLIYNVLLALAPVALVCLFLYVKFGKASFVDVVRDGQLYFFCTALAGSAIGDKAKIVGITPPAAGAGSIQEFWLVGFVFIILFSAFAFGMSVSLQLSDNRRLAGTSAIMAATTAMLVAFWRWKYNLL